MKRVDSYPARPFVKWVGGKTQLFEEDKIRVLNDNKCYYDSELPF